MYSSQFECMILAVIAAVGQITVGTLVSLSCQSTDNHSCQYVCKICSEGGSKIW